MNNPIHTAVNEVEEIAIETSDELEAIGKRVIVIGERAFHVAKEHIEALFKRDAHLVKEEGDKVIKFEGDEVIVAGEKITALVQRHGEEVSDPGEEGEGSEAKSGSDNAGGST